MKQRVSKALGLTCALGAFCVLISVNSVGAAAGVAVAAHELDSTGHPPDRCAFELLVRSLAGEPVAGARVSVVGGDSARTGDDGTACLTPDLEDQKPLQVLVTAAGYAVASTTIPPRGAGVSVVVELQRAFGDELVVSAMGKQQRLQDVPVHIRAIDRSSMVASAARSLAEAIEYSPGLRVESNCANCNTSQIRLLGLEGPYSQIVVDSQPTVSSLALVYGIEQIPARMLDGIEVLKGSGSALYGASSVAGTINLLPHQADHTHIDVDLEGTSFDGAGSTGDGEGSSVRALVDWGAEDRSRSATLHGQIDEVPLVDVNGDDFSEVTARDLAAFGVRGHTLALAESAQATYDANWTDASRRGGDALRFDLRPDQTALTEAIDTTTQSSSLRWMHTLDGQLDYRVALSWVDIERDSYYGADFDANAYGFSEGTTWVLSAQADRALGDGTLQWGVQAQADDLYDLQLGYDREVRQEIEQVGLFAQDNRVLGKGVSVLYGLRIDDHSLLENPIASPRAALMVSPRADLTLRAAYGYGFRPPAIFDEDLHIELVGGGVARVVRNAPDLREERSRSAMLSAQWRPTLGRRSSAAFEFTAFRTDLDDLFFNGEADDPTTPQLELLRTNLDGAVVEGIELAASLRLGSRVQLELSGVSQSAVFDQAEPDFGSRRFWRTPDLYGNASLRWSLSDRLDLFAGTVFTGEMVSPHFAGFIPEDRLERTPSFWAVDLNVGYRWPLGGEREISLRVGARNLTDAYQDDLDEGPLRDSTWVYGPRFPRSLFLSTGFRF